MNKYRYLTLFCWAIVLLSSCKTSVYAPAGASSAALKYSDKNVKALIEYAADFVGTPYVWGGATPEGFDCSGYVQYVYKHFGYSLPRTTSVQIGAGVAVDIMQVKAGDLVFFSGRDKRSRKVAHVGLVVESSGKGYFLFLHSSSSRGVTVNSSLEKYYWERFLGARRIMQ